MSGQKIAKPRSKYMPRPGRKSYDDMSSDECLLFFKHFCECFVEETDAAESRAREAECREEKAEEMVQWVEEEAVCRAAAFEARAEKLEAELADAKAEWERAHVAELRLREAELRAEAAEKMVKTMQHGEFLAEVRAIRAESCLEEAELGAAVAVARAEKAEAELTEQCERARSERACGELGEMPVPMELGDIVRKLEMFECRLGSVLKSAGGVEV